MTFRSAALLTAGLALAYGCGSDPEGPGRKPGSNNATGSGGSSGGGYSPPDDGTRGTPLIGLGQNSECGGSNVTGAPPMCRLSHLEYNNAVRDLFGDTTQPGQAFTAEEKVAGFNNNSLAPNQVVDFPILDSYQNEGTAERQHNDLLVTLAQGMGASSITSFGETQFNKGAITELLA